MFVHRHSIAGELRGIVDPVSDRWSKDGLEWTQRQAQEERKGPYLKKTTDDRARHRTPVNKVPGSVEKNVGQDWPRSIRMSPGRKSATDPSYQPITPPPDASRPGRGHGDAGIWRT